MLDALLQEYGIHILEATASQADVRVLASLRPEETVAACASRMKGRVSKWLREQLKLSEEQKLLSRGYFACTTGVSSEDAVLAYLDSQGEHHGYASRPLPPVFVANYSRSATHDERLNANHAVTILQFHIVLSTWRRGGIFGRSDAEAVAACWCEAQRQCPIFIEKVSFVPDHVHLAVHLHPGHSPAQIVVTLMNASQELMWNEHANAAIRARAERLWEPSAYIGSYGKLESAKIAAYVRKWEAVEHRP
jgi:REP element-mobilizing transposase RayT